MLHVLIAAALLNAAGCFGSGGPDACTLITGHTFVSVNQMECGLGANGVVTRCNWRVSFTDGIYSWAYPDVIETGSYSCDGATITTARSVASTTPLLGWLDYQTGQLTWDGATYIAQSRDAATISRCRGRGLNPQATFAAADFKSAAFTISPPRLYQ